MAVSVGSVTCSLSVPGGGPESSPCLASSASGERPSMCCEPPFALLPPLSWAPGPNVQHLPMSAYGVLTAISSWASSLQRPHCRSPPRPPWQEPWHGPRVPPPPLCWGFLWAGPLWSAAAPSCDAPVTVPHASAIHSLGPFGRPGPCGTEKVLVTVCGASGRMSGRESSRGLCPAPAGDSAAQCPLRARVWHCHCFAFLALTPAPFQAARPCGHFIFRFLFF